MKHTLLNSKISAKYSADVYQKKLPPFGKISSSHILSTVLKYASIFLILLGNTLQAQPMNPITGSGASVILNTYTFGNQPNISDPCTCAGEDNGVEIFNDEIIVQSPTGNDNWVLDLSNSTGVFLPNSSTLYSGGDPTLTLNAVGTDPATGQPVYIYTLPIAHASQLGYDANVIPGDATTMANYPTITEAAPMNVANTCSKVGVTFDLSAFTDVDCIDGTADGTPDITMGSTQTIDVDVFNQDGTNLLTGGVIPNTGEVASIYIGSTGNERKILIDSLVSGDAIDMTGIYTVTFDPSGALATGGFNPLVDTLITFEYNADTSAMSHQLGAFDSNDPGCTANTSARVNWNTCTGGTYSVGGTSQKYDNQKRTFTICPCDPNKQMTKIAFTRLDIAPGDTLTIYEGAGTSGAIRERLITGGASAATALSSTWFQSDCTNDSGCLTVVFSPDANANNNGVGFDFLPTCEDRVTVVTCPANTILPGTCDINNTGAVASLYAIPAPTATCSYEPVIMSAVTVDSNGTAVVLDPKASLTALVENGDYFDADSDEMLDVGETIFIMMGEYSFTYSYMPIPNVTPSPTCTFTVRVDEIAPVCNNQVNISLTTGSCSAVIDPDMLIEGDGCAVGYTVNILEGADAGTNIMTSSNLGKTVMVEAVSPFGNRCWGLILVEDKAAPIVTCTDAYIYCGLPTDTINNPSLIPAANDCSPFTLEFTSGVSENYNCGLLGAGNNPDTLRLERRIWTAIDEGGTRSAPCTQTIYRLRPKLSQANMIWPSDTILACEQNPSTLPAVTGFPQIRIGADIVPLETTCLFGIHYDDTNFTTDCDGTQKISRIWTILDWCNNGGIIAGSSSVLQSDTQFIKVLDTIPPTLANVPDTLFQLTNHEDCSASVIFPVITLSDVCSSNGLNYRVEGPNTTIYHTPGSTQPDTMLHVPFGQNTFYYIAEDGCGNRTIDSLVLNIKDNTPPTAIARELSVSLIDSDQLTWVYATSFDGGSHDNCGVTSVLARRVGELTFTDAVGFTCTDIPNDSLMVELQIMDECGNISLAMNRVSVSDKLGVCDCNMTTDLTVAETSGIAANDGIICEGDPAILTASGGVSYVWSTAETGNAISVSTGGVYTVTIADALGCTVDVSTTIGATSLPTPTIVVSESSGTINDGNLCAGATAVLTATGGGTYLWSTGETTAAISVTTAGTYQVTATNATTCQASTTASVTINPLPTASIAVAENSGTANDGIICNGTTATLTASGGASYLWSTGAITDAITVSATGLYVVTVTDGNGCTAVENMPIIVNTLPTATIAITETSGTTDNDGSICAGTSATLTASGGTSYTWNTGDNTAAISVSAAGVFTVTITDSNGCSVTQNRTITQHELPPTNITITETSGTTNNDGQLCNGDAATLTASGGVSYVWSNGADTNPISVSNAGTYTVTATNGSGCTGTFSVDISTSEAFSTSIAVEETSGLTGNDGTLCFGDMAILTASGGDSYLWSPGNETTPSITVNEAGTYTVVATGSGCTATASQVIVVSPRTETQVTNVSSFEADEISPISVVHLNSTVTSITNYQWNPTTGLDLSNPDTPLFDPNDQIGTYQFFVTITDNFNCMTTDGTGVITVVAPSLPPPGPMASLAGSITTEKGEEVERASIHLAGYDMPDANTGATGHYQFDSIPMYENYTVTPEKNINPLNGVSTYDLVLLSKHILGVTRLDSPYKLIAGDINRSGTITAYDMVQLRQLILNIKEEFPNNTSWRFVDAAYEFNDTANPLREAFPETYEITDLTNDMMSLDFVAIKIGDLNNSAVVRQLANTESRAAKNSLHFQAKQTLSEDGEYIAFDFSSTNFEGMLGYQFTLDFDPSVLSFDKVIPSKWMQREHFGWNNATDGKITTSWNKAEGVDIAAGEVLFSLIFRLDGEVTDENLLTIKDASLKPEAYTEFGEILNVQLDKDAIAPEVATKSLQLFQNRPNPFTGKTTIGFTLPEASVATLRIFDSAGRMIRTYEGQYEKGYNELIINSQDLTAFGALYYQLATPTQMATKKMIHTK